MTIEDDSIDQATSARRERLRALRAAKEYASMPDVNGDENHNNGSKAEFMADVHEEKKARTSKEDSIEQAGATQRERLMALRTAKELLSMPDDGLNNSNSKVEDTEEAGEHKKSETFKEDSIEQAATTRRERLMALRTAKELLSMPDDGSNNSNSKVEDTEEVGEHKEPNMKFRNYLPHDEHLQEGKLAPVDLPKFEDPIAPVQRPSDKTEDPFVNIAPKKPNWDLRRDVQKKLDKLERRTQKALYELMLEQEKEKSAMELENTGNED